MSIGLGLIDLPQLLLRQSVDAGEAGEAKHDRAVEQVLPSGHRIETVQDQRPRLLEDGLLLVLVVRPSAEPPVAIRHRASDSHGDRYETLSKASTQLAAAATARSRSLRGSGRNSGTTGSRSRLRTSAVTDLPEPCSPWRTSTGNGPSGIKAPRLHPTMRRNASSSSEFTNRRSSSSEPPGRGRGSACAWLFRSKRREVE